jgi:hypothetical protein
MLFGGRRRGGTLHGQLRTGDKTLATLKQIASTSVVRFELGPETRAMIERIAAPVEREERAGNGERTVGRLVKKGAKALRSD